MIQLVLDGKFGSFYDRVHPGVQAQSTRAAYIECASRAAGEAPSISLRVTEATDTDYTEKNGTVVPARAVTVQMSAGGAKQNAVVWLVDGKVAALNVGPDDPDDTGCLSRL